MGAGLRGRLDERRVPIEAIARAGLFDLQFYRAQFSDTSTAPAELTTAVAHYVAEGRRKGFAFHPFIEPEWWAGRAASVPARMEEIERAIQLGHIRDVTPSPLVADVVEPAGEMRDFLQRLGRGEVLGPAGPMRSSSLRESMIRAVEKISQDVPNEGTHARVDWDTVRAHTADRVPGRVSVIIATFEDWSMTVDAVRAALAGMTEEDLEIIIVDNGSRPAVFRLLTAVFLNEPCVQIIRATVNTNFSGGMNIGIARSTGEFLLFLNNDAMLAEGWLPAMLRPFGTPAVKGVQALLLYPNVQRVQAAGTMFLGPGVLPWHFLAGHPLEDALRDQDRRFSAITAAVMMVRARDVVDVGGFDEGFRNGYEDVDLCLRMLRDADDHFTVVPEARAYHPEGSSEGRSLYDTENRLRFFDRWRDDLPAPEAWRYADLGLSLNAIRPQEWSSEVRVTVGDPVLIRPARMVTAGPAAGKPALRWALCLTSRTEDASLLGTLRADLERLGQEVVSFAGGVSSADALDDVLVAFASDAPFTPRAAAVNVLLGYSGGRSDPMWDVALQVGPLGYDPDARPQQRLELLRRVLDEASLLSAARFAVSRTLATSEPANESDQSTQDAAGA
ncbi:glycosyltransferase family 2 protein [Microbacterium trichothecenolyticum]|uniref:glycosyltransferase family 2 protein n=1 Tax=Microbacterium trichothecenolyticum TaxID=69370 RepID=UPI001C6E96DF|nr:glycosyltransferase family 2 protein [Microbacterium trichothecenolyticum]MBW9119459.1 glycosyltransferase family 2 protein [Microbacterium trichothecenolyticum]